MSLEGEALARRFHVWSGRSGRRYICSVFAAGPHAPRAGLPDFADAIVLAVAIAPDGLRYPVAVFECGDAGADASANAVREWHVHLLATDPEHRRSVIADLEYAEQDASSRQHELKTAA